MLAQETVLEKLREWMEELFEIAPEDVQLESNLASDLDVDSIDAIDLVVKIKELTGKQVNPETPTLARSPRFMPLNDVNYKYMI